MIRHDDQALRAAITSAHKKYMGDEKFHKLAEKMAEGMHFRLVNNVIALIAADMFDTINLYNKEQVTEKEYPEVVKDIINSDEFDAIERAIRAMSNTVERAAGNMMKRRDGTPDMERKGDMVLKKSENIKEKV